MMAQIHNPSTQQIVLAGPASVLQSQSRRVSIFVIAAIAAFSPATVAFVHHPQQSNHHPITITALRPTRSTIHTLNIWSMFGQDETSSETTAGVDLPKRLSSILAGAALITALSFGAGTSAWAENELSDKYGGKGFDSSLVDQTCLIDKCSVQAKACLADDPSCRKGLTCTAKCMGDNS
jgi:VDE lipocalin domain